MIQSNDKGASMAIMSGGSADASLDIVVPNGKSAKIVLNETDGNSFSITNEGAADRLTIRDKEHEMIRIQAVTGDSQFRGDMTIGGSTIGSNVY